MEGKMKMAENKIKEGLFGGVEKIKAAGKHKVDIAELLKPFGGEGIIMRAFCCGCGTLAEINGDLAQEYAKNAGIAIPESPANYYFESGGCALCDSADSAVRLVALPVKE